MTFLIGFASGVVCTLTAGLAYVTREEWMDLPRIWREEPDRNMRRWFILLRRAFGAGRP